MLELIGFTTAFLVLGFMIVVALLALAAPLAWIWMLVDAILREDVDYPGTYENARLIWVLLLAFLPVTAVVYFFAVYAKAKRGAAVTGADDGHGSVSLAATPAPPASASVAG